MYVLVLEQYLSTDFNYLYLHLYLYLYLLIEYLMQV